MQPMAEDPSDSFGNMSLMSGAAAVSSFNATNRTSNLPCGSAVQAYDAAGNQLCSTDPFGGISQWPMSDYHQMRMPRFSILRSGRYCVGRDAG